MTCPSLTQRHKVPALALLCALATPGQAQERIVTVAPSLTESVCALGHCGQIVGTDRYSTGPGAIGHLPKVGGLADASIERIVALRPDLVLLGPRSRIAERLAQLGIAVQTTTCAPTPSKKPCCAHWAARWASRPAPRC